MMIRKTIYNFIPSFSCMTFVYCFFVLSVSLRDEIMLEISFVNLTIYTLISAIINTILSLKSRQLWPVASINLVVLIAFEFSVFIVPKSYSGFFIFMFTALIIATTVIAPLAISLSKFDSHKALVFTEISIVGSSFFFFAQFGTFTAPVIANVACVVAIVLNIYHLSSIRIERTRRENTSSSYVRGFIIASVIAIVVAISAVLSLAFIPSVRTGIITALLAIRNGFIFLWKTIISFLEFLLSKIPIGDTEYSPIEIESINEGIEAEAIEEMSMNFDAIILIIAVVAVALIAFLIIRFRKKRIKFGSIYDSIDKESIDRTSIKNPFILLINKLIRKIALIKSWVLRRSTYEGAFVTISHFASRRGLKRGIDETPKEYFSRIVGRIYLANGEAEEENICSITKVLDVISQKIDTHNFSLNGEKYLPMKQNEVKILHEFVKGLKNVPKIAR